MKIRLHGTEAETEAAFRRLEQVFEIVDVSVPYLDRPPSRLVRVYVEIRLDLDRPPATGEGAPWQP